MILVGANLPLVGANTILVGANATLVGANAILVGARTTISIALTRRSPFTQTFEGSLHRRGGAGSH